MKVGLIIVLTFVSESFAVTNYISHIQNFVNLVSAYNLDGYSTNEFPPLADVSQPMVVNIDIHLYAINGFDEVAGNIELVVAMVISWTDEMPIIQSISFQIQDRSEFLVPYDMIWTPKLVLTNAIGETSGVGDIAYLCRFDMRTNGVWWKPRVIVSSSCTPDVTYYPFDKQTCEFIYTAWGFKASEVLLTTSTDEWNQDEYGESGEWNIATTSTETYIQNDQSYIKFTLNIVRKPLYFAFNILLPVLVLCLLNSTVFLLPAESGERVGFSVTCFLSFMVLLNMIMDIMPRSSSPISFLCYYLVVMMSNSGAMTLVTILLMRVYHKPEKSTVPKWLQRCVTFVNCGCARLVCCVLCCRAIRDRCCCPDKKRCGCTKTEDFLQDDSLVEITVKDSKIKEHPVEQRKSGKNGDESQPENKSKCGCFRSCTKQIRSAGNVCSFGCKKCKSGKTSNVETKPLENIEQPSKSSCCSFIRNRRISKLPEDNNGDTSGASRVGCCFGGDKIKAETADDTKHSDQTEITEYNSSKVPCFCINFGKGKCEGTKGDDPQRLGQDEMALKESNGSGCFCFLRKSKTSTVDIVDIDNDILPLAKQSSESNKFRPALNDKDATNADGDLLNGWNSSQTDTTNRKRKILDPISVSKNNEKPQVNIESGVNTHNDETECKIELKTHAQNASPNEKKPKQQTRKTLDDTNIDDKNIEKQNVNTVNYQVEKDVALKSHDNKETTEIKTPNREVKFVKETSEDEMLPEMFQPQKVSRRKSIVSGKQKRKKSTGAIRIDKRRGSVSPDKRRGSVSPDKRSGSVSPDKRRGSVIPKHSFYSDSEDSDSVDSSEVDSLADLEEEVSWPEVGRIMDKFFFLVFSGGQAFLTVVFLVPLFTAPSADE